MIDETQIESWFGAYELSEAQKSAYEEVRQRAHDFVVAVNEQMPDGDDKVQVVQSVRQSILTVELAIRHRWQPLIRMAKGVN